ncbi:MAG: MFS transporter [Alphaproteobacteria bacterium]|jgi:MHS family proline/betaine transporter-like MFS transporter|nr:MFS transporter [Alphaproteobacteria bacterium]
MTNIATNIKTSPLENFEQPVLEKASPVKVPIFFISVLGTVLEYFEYAIYGFLAPILAIHFFPSDDPTTSLIKAFGVFAVGSLSKPFGALIFGYLGDTQGRRISLRYSMIGISFPTFIVGILPGYEAWGWGAAIALVVCRMLQGIFIAGESDGVHIYVFEHFAKKNPCLITCLVGCGAYLGIALASLVAAHVPAVGESWRFVFLGCSIFGFIVFILRRYLIETPPFLAYLQQHLTPAPLKEVAKTHWAPILRTIMICGAGGGAYHFYLVFQGTYLSKILGMAPAADASLYSFYLTSLYVLFLPVAGWAADVWGLARIGKIGGFFTMSLVALNAVLISDGIVSFPLMILTTLSMVFFFAPGYLFLIQQYEVGVRFRCMSLGHTIGSMLFSGTTPVVCLFLWQFTSLSYAPFLYFLFLVVMGLAAFIWGDE